MKRKTAFAAVAVGVLAGSVLTAFALAEKMPEDSPLPEEKAFHTFIEAVGEAEKEDLGRAPGAEISVFSYPGQDVSLVFVRGAITIGDADRFLDAISGIPRAMVALEGPGGLLSEALTIGAEIRTRDFATMVAPESGCYSACALIWISGPRRYMSPSSQIGFHAAYKEEGGDYRESGVGNAEVGSFLTHLGFRIEAIRFFTIAGPREIVLLTPDRARALGVDVFVNERGTILTPHDAPTADTYARRWVSYGSSKRSAKICSSSMQPFSIPVRETHSNGVPHSSARSLGPIYGLSGSTSYAMTWPQAAELWLVSMSKPTCDIRDYLLESAVLVSTAARLPDQLKLPFVPTRISGPRTES